MKLFVSLSLSLSLILASCAQSVKKNIKTVELTESQFQVYNSGFTAGTLKIVTAKAIESFEYQPLESDVLVLDRLPKLNVLTRGLIVSRPASGSEETTMRSRAVSVPFVFIAGASKSDQFQKLENKKVFFKPAENETSFSLMPLNDETYVKFNEVLKTRFEQVKVEIDKQVLKTKRDFLKIGTASSTDSNLCGPTPVEFDSIQGFCIRFYYFDTFTKMNKRGSLNLKEYALNQLKTANDSADTDAVREAVQKIQQAFMDAKMSDRHVEDIRREVLKAFEGLPPKETLVFRGARNTASVPRLYLLSEKAEAELSFKSVKAMKPEKIEKMIKNIWASMYSYQNYSARKLFSINESNVYTSVLVYKKTTEDSQAVLNTAGFGIEPPRFSKPILMFDPEAELFSILDKEEYGPIGQSTLAQYKLKVPLGMDFLKFKEGYKQVEIEMSDFYKINQVLKIKNANVVSEEPWKRGSKTDETETRNYRLFFETDHPYFKDLNMAINYTSVRKNGQVISDNIVTLDQAKIERLVHKKHYLFRPRDKKINSGTGENKRYIVADLSSDNKTNFSKSSNEKAYCYKGEKIAVVRLEDEKTESKQIKLLKNVEPFNLKKDLIIDKRFRVYGGPLDLEQTKEGLFEQYSVFLAEKKLPDLEEVRFLAFTDFVNPQKIQLSTFNEEMKRLEKYKLDEDCSL